MAVEDVSVARYANRVNDAVLPNILHEGQEFRDQLTRLVVVVKRARDDLAGVAFGLGIDEEPVAEIREGGRVGRNIPGGVAQFPGHLSPADIRLKPGRGLCQNSRSDGGSFWPIGRIPCAIREGRWVCHASGEC